MALCPVVDHFIDKIYRIIDHDKYGLECLYMQMYMYKLNIFKVKCVIINQFKSNQCVMCDTLV